MQYDNETLIINDFIESGRSDQVKYLVILLHGYGANANDISGISDSILSINDDIVCVAPEGPNVLLENDNKIHSSRCWFELYDISEDLMFNGLCKAGYALNLFIDDTLKRLNLTDDKLFIFGFSQGAMLGIYAGISRDNACAGIISFSGAIVGINEISDSIIKSKPKICLIHGNQDDVVGCEASEIAKNFLEDHGFDIECHILNDVSHYISTEGLLIGNKFVRDNLENI